MPAEAATLASSLPSAGALAAGVGGGLVVAGSLALLMRRRPDALAQLAVLALPFRVPVTADGRTVNLLVPLYLVIAAGVIEALAPGGAPWHRRGATEPRFGGGVLRRATPRALGWLLLASVALYALQALYSVDRAKGAENIAFFYLPFGLLFMLLSRVRWSRALMLRCLAIAAALAVLFAGIGFVEYSRKSLFLNPKLVAANQYDNYFRVNSVFFDPNIYGRYLALVMIALATLVLWSGARRAVFLGAGVLAWLLAGLVTSFSQSSIAALLLGLAALAAWRWELRRTLYASVLVLALGGLLLLLAPASLHFGLKGTGGSTSNATSGRTKLISGGLELFAKRPLQGFGSGSFETEYKRHSHTTEQNATSASHTIPITIAAEQGLVGLALYITLLVVAAAVLLRGAGRSPPRIAIAACFAALLLHTWTYADFLEDPFTWTLLAVGVALARARGGEGEAPERGGAPVASAQCSTT